EGERGGRQHPGAGGARGEDQGGDRRRQGEDDAPCKHRYLRCAHVGRPRSLCRPQTYRRKMVRMAGASGGPRRAYDSPMADVTTHDDGPVRVITLSRPEVRNALSRTLRDALRAEVAAAEADGAVRVGVLSGARDAIRGRRSP